MAPFYFDSIYKSVLLVFKTVNYTSLKSNDVCTDQVLMISVNESGEDSIHRRPQGVPTVTHQFTSGEEA